MGVYSTPQSRSPSSLLEIYISDEWVVQFSVYVMIAVFEIIAQMSGAIVGVYILKALTPFPMNVARGTSCMVPSS